jgi:polyisoprenyl-teichoic acid--peptidoglycan teichoic acid transferase
MSYYPPINDWPDPPQEPGHPDADPWAETHPIYVPPPPPPVRQAYPRRRRPRRRMPGCCLPVVMLFGCLLLAVLGLLFLPMRTNVLLLGMDYTDPGSSAARTDTMILTTFIPLDPYAGMLSIPRDLWVTIPAVGENRINTAHFFAEASQPGSGPAAAVQTVETNFGVEIDYFVRIRFEGFRELFNAMGGVDIVLDQPMAGYPAGAHHLTGNKALAFARNRTNSDDFFRMQQSQILLKAAFKQMLNPLKWPRLPQVITSLFSSIETDLPIWQQARLGLTLLRTGPDGIDNRTITREMVVPFTTNQGASVLAPNWGLINPVLMEMFGQ